MFVYPYQYLPAPGVDPGAIKVQMAVTYRHRYYGLAISKLPNKFLFTQEQV
jgi:hypothetical protein